MSAVTVQTAFDTFTRDVGQRAAMVTVSRVLLSDFDPALDAVRRSLGPLLTTDERATLQRAAYALAHAVNDDPMTTSAHADFREAVGQVKSRVLLRSLGAASAGG